MTGLLLPFAPMAKPRQTQRDKWAQRPVVQKYRAWADAARAYASRADFTLPEGGAVLRFYLPMPPSWSKRKRAAMDGTPHRQRPDVDNLTKAVLDALLPDGDARVWQITAEKRWASTARVEIEIRPLTDSNSSTEAGEDA